MSGFHSQSVINWSVILMVLSIKSITWVLSYCQPFRRRDCQDLRWRENTRKFIRQIYCQFCCCSKFKPRISMHSVTRSKKSVLPDKYFRCDPICKHQHSQSDTALSVACALLSSRSSPSCDPITWTQVVLRPDMSAAKIFDHHDQCNNSHERWFK